MSGDAAFDPMVAGPADSSPLSAPGVTPPTLSGAGRRFLSDILVELGFVDAASAENAVAAARNPGSTPEKVLLDRGAITEDQLARALAERYGLEHIDLDEFEVDASAAGVLREAAARRYQAAPVGFAADGALVLAVSDPADSLGLSDIAVMTKLAVRPVVAARAQIERLLDTLEFMQEPVQGAAEQLGTVLVPPEEAAQGDVPAGDAEPAGAGTAEAGPASHASGAAAGDDASERELARLREELAMALVARDEAVAALASDESRAEAAAERAREETAGALRAEHERELARLEAEADEKLRAERASAQHALNALRARHDEALEAERAKHNEARETERAKHDQALEAERAKRTREVEAERARTAAAIDAERERNAKELEALRARGEQALAEERARYEAALAAVEPGGADPARIAELEQELAAAREQVELTADADRRAEAARAALGELRDEHERQAQVHALTERELRAELDALRAELSEPSHK